MKECGECSACCFVLAVEELQKPYYTRCQYQSVRGCSIYGEHPQTCQIFSCLWKLDFYDRPRPDRFGYLLVPGLNRANKEPQGYLDVFEIEKSDKGNGIIERLNKIVNQILSKPNRVSGVRIHRHGAFMGIEWATDLKYRGGNYYLEDPKQKGLFWHVSSGQIEQWKREGKKLNWLGGDHD